MLAQQANQPTAGAGLVGLADDGLLGPDGGLGGVARQLLAEQFRIGGGHGNHLALWRHHHAGIEVPQLFLLAPRFFRHQRWPGFHVGQHVSAVGQIPPYVVQKATGRAAPDNWRAGRRPAPERPTAG
ncbi:hypothetical protein G6F35_017174 [Rhizopus arrhizus]|nr:hypothetical protein G6F35_017174 [Rhizopus arrhizus]